MAYFQKHPERVFNMTSFKEMAQAGNLPRYSFIEPRLGPTKLGPTNHQHPPSSVAAGEQLIKDVYEALRSGKNLARGNGLLLTHTEIPQTFRNVSCKCTIIMMWGRGAGGCVVGERKNGARVRKSGLSQKAMDTAGETVSWSPCADPR